MAVKLIFSFDSEDYETPAADDAEKWWAETMTKHGITACVCVVGELARALRARGRRDVVDAMARHEIAFHSDMHSAHPTWAEYLDECGWEDGVARVLREEGRGIADVRDLFGQHPSAWCKPGASWGPPVAEAMARMDVPIFCDSPFEAGPGQPLWYNDNLFLAYHTSFDRYFSLPHDGRLEQMKSGLGGLADAHDGGYLVMYTHPCRLFTTKFTDTFRYGNNPPREQWQPAPLRPPEEIASLQKDFDAFLAWVVSQPNVALTTYRELYERYRPTAAPWLSADEVRRLVSKTPAFDEQRLNGISLSPAEQFGVIARAAAACGETGRMPEAIPVRRLRGPTESPPPAIVAEALSIARLIEVAREVDARCVETGGVPARIEIGGRAIGPNAFMQAAAEWLREERSPGAAPRSVTPPPVAEYPAITEREPFQEMRFKDGWSIFPPGFEGNRVLEMIRLQAWTAKSAVASPA